MHWLDWLILLLPIGVCAAIAVRSRRYVRTVSDFMAGGRHAGRYLICTARSEQGSGAAVFVGAFQAFLVSGFTISWWGQLSVPAGLLLMVTGYVIYRYRQTKVLTLGELFERRYSRNFRLFAGVLGFVAGLLNFGIIPAVGARFMVAFLQLPQTVHLLTASGPAVPTYLVLMAMFLTVCVIMTTTAGQISVLLTDCAEGMFSQLFYTVIAVVLLVNVFDWSETKHVLLDTNPGESLVNPFDSLGLKDFNIWFVLIGVFFIFYRTIAWQNQHAFNSSAATPHESRMGGVLGKWRAFAAGVMVTLLSLCAITFFKTHTAEIEAVLSRYSDPAVRNQMRAPVALTMMLPIGVKGALLSICLMGIIAGDGIHLHSWSSIFIQDVVMPLRKRPLSPTQHLRLLRMAVVGVAVWAFFFGWLFPQTKYIAYWWSITEAVFVSGAGVALIGGLYWSRGTTAGAWAGLIVGALLAGAGIGTEFYFQRVMGRSFYLSLPEISFYSSITAVLVYGAVSWLTCRERFDMDWLLNRGAYADPAEVVAEKPVGPKRSWLYRVLTFGIDEHFTRGDRFITVGITAWSMLWFAIFLIGTVVTWFHPFANEAWATYWLWMAVYLPLVIGTVTTVWFTWGCTRDMVVFFRRLREDHANRPVESLFVGPTMNEPVAAIVPGAVLLDARVGPAASVPAGKQ